MATEPTAAIVLQDSSYRLVARCCSLVHKIHLRFVHYNVLFRAFMQDDLKPFLKCKMVLYITYSVITFFGNDTCIFQKDWCRRTVCVSINLIRYALSLLDSGIDCSVTNVFI